MAGNVKVKSYKNEKDMQKDIPKMMAQGYRMQMQTGSFDRRGLSFNIGRKGVVTITWVK